MFANVSIRGIHASRYIMSWVRTGGEINSESCTSDFAKWLKSIGLNEDEIETICEIARNGKMELELSAKRFIENMKTAKV